MKVGIPKELKNHEYRVAMTPAGVHELARSGHEVFVERDAGAGLLIPDDDFVTAGATILPDTSSVSWAVAPSSLPTAWIRSPWIRRSPL